MTQIEVNSVEVCHGGALRGYAIFFSGGWDAYLVIGGKSLTKVGSNYLAKKDAVKAILEGWDWRTDPVYQAGGGPPEENPSRWDASWPPFQY